MKGEFITVSIGRNDYERLGRLIDVLKSKHLELPPLYEVDQTAQFELRPDETCFSETIYIPTCRIVDNNGQYLLWRV